MESGSNMVATKEMSRIQFITEKLLRTNSNWLVTIPMIMPYVAATERRKMNVALLMGGRELRPAFINGPAVLLAVDENYAPALAKWHSEGKSIGEQPIFLLEEGVDIVVHAVPRRPTGGTTPVIQLRWQVSPPRLNYDPLVYLQQKLFNLTAEELRGVCKTVYNFNVEGVYQFNGTPENEPLTSDSAPRIKAYYWSELDGEEVRTDKIVAELTGRSLETKMPMESLFRLALLLASKHALVAYPMTTLCCFVPEVDGELDTERAVFAPLLRIVAGPPLKKVKSVEGLVTISNACFVFVKVTEDFDPQTDVMVVTLDDIESWANGEELHYEKIGRYSKISLTDLITRTTNLLRAPQARTSARPRQRLERGLVSMLKKQPTQTQAATSTSTVGAQQGEEDKTQHEGGSDIPPPPDEG